MTFARSAADAAGLLHNRTGSSVLVGRDLPRVVRRRDVVGAARLAGGGQDAVTAVVLVLAAAVVVAVTRGGLSARRGRAS